MAEEERSWDCGLELEFDRDELRLGVFTLAPEGEGHRHSKADSGAPTAGTGAPLSPSGAGRVGDLCLGGGKTCRASSGASPSQPRRCPPGAARCSGGRRAGPRLPRGGSGGRRPARRGAAAAAASPLPQAAALRLLPLPWQRGRGVARALGGARSLAYDVHCREPIRMGFGGSGACPRAVRRAVAQAAHRAAGRGPFAARPPGRRVRLKEAASGPWPLPGRPARGGAPGAMALPAVHRCLQLSDENEQLVKKLKKLHIKNKELENNLGQIQEKLHLQQLMHDYVTSRDVQVQTETRLWHKGGYGKDLNLESDSARLLQMYSDLQKRYVKEIKTNQEQSEAIKNLTFLDRLKFMS
ncbi:uncharacterized protein [Ciconia boyciana]|uniref:uncharacterized protein n=1 Tax=Ciconia boyciana TaxID=52775 RepID=UPI003BA2F9F7